MEDVERDTRVVSTWVFVVSCVLAMFGLIPSVLFLIFNLRYRSVRYILQVFEFQRTIYLPELRFHHLKTYCINNTSTCVFSNLSRLDVKFLLLGFGDGSP